MSSRSAVEGSVSSDGVTIRLWLPVRASLGAQASLPAAFSRNAMQAGMPALPGLTHSALRGNVRCAKANGLIVDVGSALGVQRRPARRILEQPDRSDFAVLAQIEPVQSAPRNADQIAGFDFY